MAKYGYITQPIESKISGLAALYLQGQEKINAIRTNVREMRAENMMQLGKKIDSIALTGIQDLDKMYNESGVLLRNRVMQAEADNRSGKISMADYTRIYNNAMTEMGMIVNGNEVIGKNYETLKKRNKDREISGASLDLFEQGYFGNKNALLDPARFSILDDTPNGLAFTQYYTYTNSKGQKVAGTPISVPFANNMNPEFGNIAYFDPDAYAKSIRNQIGKKYGFFPGDFEQLDIKGKGTFLSRVSEPENLEMIRTHIEGFVNSFVDSDLIGVLYEGLGARAPYSNSYVKTLNQQEWEAKTTFDFIDSDGKVKTLPMYADADGNGFTFTEDPFTLRHSQSGEIQLSDEQRELARGLLRANAIAALNVTRDKYFYKNPNYKGSSSKPPELADNFTINPMFTPVKNGNDAPLFSFIYGNAERINYRKGVLKGQNKTLSTTNAGILSNPAATDWKNVIPSGQAAWKTNNFTAFEKVLGIGTGDLSKTNISQGFIEHVDMGQLLNKKDFPSLKLTTFENTPFETLQGVGYIKTEELTDNGMVDRYAVVVSGTSKLGDTASKYTQQGGIQLQAGDEVIEQSTGYVAPTQTVALLNALRKYPEFNKHVEKFFSAKGSIDTSALPPGLDSRYHASYIISIGIDNLK